MAIDMTTVEIAITLQVMYGSSIDILHLILINPKGQGQGHAYSDCKYLGN